MVLLDYRVVFELDSSFYSVQFHCGSPVLTDSHPIMTKVCPLSWESDKDKLTRITTDNRENIVKTIFLNVLIITIKIIIMIISERLIIVDDVLGTFLF